MTDSADACVCQLPSLIAQTPKGSSLADGVRRRLQVPSKAKIRWDCDGAGSHHACFSKADRSHIMARAPVCASGVEKVPTRVLPLTLALVLETVSWLGTVTLEVWYPANR